MNNDAIILQLHEGKLTLPKSYKEAIKLYYGVNIANTTVRMFEAAWHHYLLNKGTISLPYWAEQFNNPGAFNKILKELSKAGWIICDTKPDFNWSEGRLNEDKLLEYLPMWQLEGIRAYHKFQKYQLTCEKPEYNNKTRINGKVKDTGLVRPGLFKTAHTEFQFDVDAIQEHYDIIVAEVNKGMTKVREFYPEMRRDTASYDEVSETIVNSIINNPDAVYSSGQFHSDSRGRNIAGMLSKVFNPIGFKVARATLIIPAEYRNKATGQGLINKYLFIAELNGFKKGTLSNKINFGRECYYTNRFPNLDHRDEKQRKDFYEVIWLQRTYDELDAYFQLETQTVKKLYQESVIEFYEAKARIELNPSTSYYWKVPIEIDMSASVLGYVGLLTNHKPFMERCNMLGDELVDAWEIKGIKKRKQAKVIMRTIYGSNQSQVDMWRDEGIEYTAEDILAYDEALRHGEIAVGDRFSKFIINNCNPREEMTLHVMNEHFKVECNRYRHVGERTIGYTIYDTATDLYRDIHHTTTRSVADLDQFRRFMVTGLIHNLDGQVIDRVGFTVMDEYRWMIDIYDAAVLCCEAATLARTTYAKELEHIHANRREILTNYFVSINIPASALKEWEEVEKVVVPFTGTLKVNPMVLK